MGQVGVRVSGHELKVSVLRREVTRDPSEAKSDSADGDEAPASITYYILDHPIFRERDDIYPAPQTARRTLEFYSLWCQSVARIIDLEAPDVFHCPDFHGAMAVMYVERPLPVLLVLHNAEYQGSISSQNMGRREARHLADVFNLRPQRIREAPAMGGPAPGRSARRPVGGSPRSGEGVLLPTERGFWLEVQRGSLPSALILGRKPL